MLDLALETFEENLIFENMKAWGMNNYYSQFGLYGQCTWFAWGRFYELYGYSPGFTGDGTQCVDQLVAAHPDKFVKSKHQKLVQSSRVLGIIMLALSSHGMEQILLFKKATLMVELIPSKKPKQTGKQRLIPFLNSIVSTKV